MGAHGCEMVPQLVFCHKCAAVLYEGEELKSPYEIIESYEGKCPNCGKKLSYIPKNFEVKPVDETDQTSPLEPEKKRSSRKKSRKKPRNVKEKGMRKPRTEIRGHMEEGKRVEWTFALIVEQG